jgi:hypothetical protein
MGSPRKAQWRVLALAAVMVLGIAASARGVPCSEGCFDVGDCDMPLALCIDGLCVPGLELTCDDGIECTVDDCDLLGGCTARPEDALCPASQCTAGICDPEQGGCTQVPVPGTCDDGDLCTDGDTCSDGTCSGTPRECNDACVVGQTCVAGACVGGTPRDCSDSNPCTVDDCEPAVGCVHVPTDSLCEDGSPCTAGTCGEEGCIQAPASGPCDDGNPCTSGDTCSDRTCAGTPLDCSHPCLEGRTCAGGQCFGGTPVVCTDSNPCTLDRCEPGVGCVHVPSDPLCEDGNACTANVCDAEEGCLTTARTGPSCNDGDGCTVGDTCENGACVGSPRDCSDPCFTGRTCVGGQCTGGTPVDCTDTNSCTIDRCVPASGCVHQPADERCADTDPCTAGVCDPVSGCRQTPLTGPACNDGDPCTTEDRCEAGLCHGQPRVCAPDAFACTDERCVNGTCLNVAIDARCDMEECASGACRPRDPDADRRGCVPLPASEGEPCTDDGLACTDDVCSKAGCLHVPIDSRCNASDQCTTAVCAPEREDRHASGCAVELGQENPRDGEFCAEDGNPCSDDRCRAGRCVHEPIPEASTCAPVTGAFRKALGLAGLTRGLNAEADEAALPGSTAGAAVTASLSSRLERIETDLEGVALALAGKSPEASLRPAVARPRPLVETPAQLRARIAFVQVQRTPRQVQAFLQLLNTARARAALQREKVRTLRGQGRLLLRGTKTLKGELKRLQQVTRTFAR